MARFLIVFFLIYSLMNAFFYSSIQGPASGKMAGPYSADNLPGPYGFCADRDPIARKRRPGLTGADKCPYGI